MINVSRRALLSASVMLIPSISVAQPVNVPPDVLAILKSSAKTPLLTVNGVHRVPSRVLKVQQCTLMQNSQIIMEELDHDWISIAIDTLNIEGNSLLTRTELINSNGKDGVNGRPGVKSIQADGKHGTHGGPGSPGEDGRIQEVPEVFVFVREILFRGIPASPSDMPALRIWFNGYNGGDGGRGGNGGNGGDGAKGVKARSGFFDCSSGPGHGGNGGDAGTAATGGRPGRGTDARNIYMFVASNRINAMRKAKYSNSGGKPGHLGRPGDLGIPGKGGPAGDSDGNCSPRPDRKGRDGFQPGRCANPDYNAPEGESAKTIFFEFNAFDEIF
ncbi:hypothetical protein [Azospirillum doebereinerae]